METAKAQSGMELPRRPRSPCWKKKAPDAGFLDNVKDHFEQFVNTSLDQHRICLKKSIRGVEEYVKLKKQQSKLFSSSKVASESNSTAKEGEVTSH